MPNNKIMGIAVVAILIVAAVAGGFILMGDDDGEETIKKGRLTIFGNANNDDYIDSDDVKFIEKILDDISNGGSWDKEEYPYADANYDDKITQSDVDTCKNMVQKKHDHVYYLNSCFEIERADYPVKTLAGTGTYVLNGIVTLGLEDITYGISDSKKWFDDVFWGKIKDTYKISTGMGSAQTEKVFELMDNMRAEGKVLDCIITTDNTMSNANDFINAGVDVLRLPFGDDNEVNAYLILGYMTQREERSHQVASFYDEIMDYKDKLSEKNNGKDITALTIYSKKYLYGTNTLHGLITNSLGISNIYTPESSGTSQYITLSGNDEWLSNPEWNADHIIGQEKMLYKNDTDIVSLWKDVYAASFSVLDAMPKNCVIINDSLLEPLKVAYLLEYLYPDDVEKGYGDKMHQKFVDKFNSHLSGSYDVTTDGTFCITYDDVKNKL